MRLAVIGDIHANAHALRAALAVVDARGFDLLVLLGDLLTYGASVQETLDLTVHRVARGNAVVLRGNHDALYEQLLGGDCSAEYLSRLPAWIRESVQWTFARLPMQLWSELRFLNEYVVDDLLFSHANPFGVGCWSYINTESDHFCAVRVLMERAMRAGIFGHTHRVRWFRSVGGVSTFRAPSSGTLDVPAVHILNAGAIGQPRDRADLLPHVLWIDQQPDDLVRIAFERYTYDVAAYMREIDGSSMSTETRARICAFFQS